MDHWSKRLWRALSWKGWSQRELARRTGLDEQKVYKYLQGKVDQPRGDTLLRLADTLGVTETWLRYEVGTAVTDIPIVGRVSTGETFVPFDDAPMTGGLETLEFVFEEGDPIAVEVRGESMLPVYRPGDYLLCARYRGDEIERALGKDCVVKTTEGEGFVKKLVAGSKRDTYTLVSYNAAPMDSAKLLWAAPVVWVKRA